MSATMREAAITLPSGNRVTFRPARRRCWYRIGDDGLKAESVDLNGIGWDASMSDEDRAACDALMRRTLAAVADAPMHSFECMDVYLAITSRVSEAYDTFMGCGAGSREAAERSYTEAIGMATVWRNTEIAAAEARGFAQGLAHAAQERAA